MSEAWIPLECSECDQSWETDPSDMPAPDEQFTCDHCGSSRPVTEFAKTQRGLEILESFHGVE